MNKMKTMSIVWGMMIISMVGVLTFIGVFYNKKLKDYAAFEDKLGKACEKYVDDNELLTEDVHTLKINIKTLKENNYIEELAVNKNNCKGYVNVTKTKSDINYETFIDCGKYQTEGYKK